MKPSTTEEGVRFSFGFASRSALRGLSAAAVATLLAGLLTVVAPTAAAGPTPTTGALTQKAGIAGCITDDGSSGTCTDGNALFGARDVAVSPDGKNVYAASLASDAVSVFDRDPTTGAITQKAGTDGCISDDGTSGTCTDGNALDVARAIVVSPDGKNVYVGASGSKRAIAIFDRDPTTGALTQKAGTDGCLADFGNDGTCGTAAPMSIPDDIAVSPDGSTVYVAASTAVLVLDRNPTTGALTQKAGAAGCIGAGGCTFATIVTPSSVVVSPDGASVYAAGTLAGGASLQPLGVITVLDRDGTTGILTPVAGDAGCISSDDTASGTDGSCTEGVGLEGVASVSISPDGANVYAGSFGDDALTVFDRDPGTGVLTQKAGADGCISDSGIGGCVDGEALTDVRDVTVSPDGASVYTSAVSSIGVEGVGIFDRDPSTGALAQKAGTDGCINDSGSSGACTVGVVVDGSDAFAVSPDGTSAYSASRAAGSLTVFDRVPSSPSCDATVSDEAEYRAALACADTAESATTITLGADITIDDGTDPTYSGTEALTIDGDGHLLDAQTSSRVLNVDSPADLTVNSVRATGASTGGGGAIAAGDAVTISDSDFAGSAAANGGGAVLAQGPVTISGSTFRGNIADGGAGGGAVRGSGDVTITNSTFTGNDAANGGSAISAVGKVTVEHVTVADNTGSDQITADTLDATASVFDRHNDSGANCDIATASTSGAHNYATDDTCGLDGEDDIDDGDDPLLGHVRDNGATPTMFPLNGSPLIDAIAAGDCADSPAADQRGVTRPFGADCDIGAIEAVFPAHGFTDATPFFEPTIRWVTSTVNTPQILNGFPDNTFGQELDITRGQAARLYYRGAGSPDPLAQPPHGFSDVTPFYEDAVRWAKGVGLFNGYPDNTFRQGDPIARGEYIRSLYNFAGTQDVDAEGLDPHGLSDVTPFYEDAVRWAKAWGLANGFPDNTFRQTNNIKRGNAARTFYNTAQTPTAWADTMTAPPNMLFRTNLGP